VCADSSELPGMFREPRRTALRFLLLCSALLAGALAAQPDGSAAEDPEEALRNELRAVITSWASAWQSQMDDVYLLHYHRDFVPEGVSGREEWEALRRSRLSDPETIQISLREFEIVQANDDIAVVRFMLMYSRPGYADQTLKEMRLRLDGMIWRIERENNLSVVKLPPP